MSTREGRTERIHPQRIERDRRIFGTEFLKGADEQALRLRQSGTFVGDMQYALALCRGIVQAEACEAVAGDAGDYAQRQRDVIGRFELAIAPGEVAVWIKAFRVLANDRHVEVGYQRVQLRP